MRVGSINCYPFIQKTLQKLAKGGLISKCLFGVFNSPQKMNGNNLTWGTLVVKLIFSLFLGRIEDTKNIFWNQLTFIFHNYKHHTAFSLFKLELIFKVRFSVFMRLFYPYVSFFFEWRGSRRWCFRPSWLYFQLQLTCCYLLSRLPQPSWEFVLKLTASG